MKRILVIDDDTQVRGMLRAVLQDAGYEVIEAEDGNRGLRLFRDNEVHLIITDIIMPDKEGLETIMDVKKESPDVRIIAISGGARVGPFSYLTLAEKFGAHRVFSKPLPMQELLEAIEELLHSEDRRTG